MGWGFMLVALVIGTVVGKLAHEATHAAVARILGADDVRVAWLHANVYYRLHGSIWTHRAIALAPLAVGMLVVLPGYLALQGRFSWDVVDIGFAAAWTWYTLLGGIEDYRFDRERAAGQVQEAD